MPAIITVTCPECAAVFSLSSALTRQARDLLLDPERERLRSEAMREAGSQIEVLQRELVRKEREAAHQEQERERERARERDEAKAVAMREAGSQIKALQQELVRKEREAAHQEQERRRERARERDELRAAAEEAAALRFQAQLNDKDSQLQRVSTELEKVRRKASTGSAQQGGVEAQKLIGIRLQELFPEDEVEVVRQGQRGADVKQTVRTANRRPLGKILWESKNAAAWSHSWIEKVRQDRDEAGADVGVIVSRALPRGVAGMTLVKDVPVVAPEFVHVVAPLLRQQVQQEARHRLADSAKTGTAERILKYLTAGAFVPHLVRAVEAAANLQEGIAKERLVAERRWVQQQKEAESVIQELAGIAFELDAEGAQLPAIPRLEAAALLEG